MLAAVFGHPGAELADTRSVSASQLLRQKHLRTFKCKESTKIHTLPLH